MNTKQKGDLAVAQCISQISLMGHEVLLPLGDRKPYDLVVDIRGQLNKVQVKYAGIGYKNKCVVQLRLIGGNKTRITTKKYKDGDFDLLFVYTERGDKYFIPWEKLDAWSSIEIESKKYQEYKVG